MKSELCNKHATINKSCYNHLWIPCTKNTYKVEPIYVIQIPETVADNYKRIGSGSVNILVDEQAHKLVIELRCLVQG